MNIFQNTVCNKILFVFILFFSLNLMAVNGIVASKHDFSSLGWSGGQICNVCHTPHSAQSQMAAPLWNHANTTAVFTVYSSPTLTAIPGQPGDISKICLSCHDGTVALDNFGGMSGSNMISGTAMIGTDLSNDHPVGIEWTHKEVNGCSNCHDFRNPNARLLPFFNRKVECVSCHDPHNNGTGEAKMLRMTNRGSAICLVCHQK